MKNYRLFIGMLALLVLISGCNTAYLHYRPGIVISHRTVVTQKSHHEEDTYNNQYDYSGGSIVTSSTEIWIGTTIILGGIQCYWCDYCHIWHPRCYTNYCYCAPVVRNHYGYYVFNHYRDHCFYWSYEPRYVPVVSKYRFKSNGRFVSYEVERKKREFTRNGTGTATKERIRYRGKEENRYVYKPETDKNTGDLKKTNTPVQKNTDNGNRTENRSRTETRNTQTKKNTGTESRNGKSNGRESSRTGAQVKKRTTERRTETIEKRSSTGNRTARVEKNKNRKNNGRSLLSRIGSIISKTKSSSRGENTRGKTKGKIKTGDRSKKSGGGGKAKQPVKKSTTKRKDVKKKN